MNQFGKEQKLKQSYNPYICIYVTIACPFNCPLLGEGQEVLSNTSFIIHLDLYIFLFVNTKY